MIFLETSQKRITEDKNDRNVPHLEIIVNIKILLKPIINKIQESSIHSVQINHLVIY